MGMKRNGGLSPKQIIALVILFLPAAFSHAQEGPTILAGHGALSGSILPLWVGDGLLREIYPAAQPGVKDLRK
jgi:hypothetical protein